MPGFLGYQIADDAESVSAREASPTGFIPSDERLLEYLKIIKKGKYGKEVNTSLIQKAQDVRDFLAWVSGPKQLPLPPLVRKILCLQRALLVASNAHTNTSSQLRTGVRSQVDAIDRILALDGVKDPKNPQLCETQGLKFKPGSVKMGAAVESRAAAPRSGETHFHCDTSSLMKVLMEIKQMLARLEAKAPASATAQIQNMKRNVQLLSSVSQSDPGSAAVQLVNTMIGAAKDGESETLKSLQSQLGLELDSTYLLTTSQAALIRAGLEQIALHTANNTGHSELLRKLSAIKTVPDIDLKPVLDAITGLPQVSPELLASLRDAVNPTEIRQLLQDLPPSAVPAGATTDIQKQLEQFDTRYQGIQVLLTDIQEKVSNVRAIQDMIEKLRIDIDDAEEHNEILRRLGELQDAMEALRMDPATLEQINERIGLIHTFLERGLPSMADITPKLEALRTELATAVATAQASATSAALAPEQFDRVIEQVNTRTREVLDTLLQPIRVQLDAIRSDTAPLPQMVTNTREGVGSLQEQMESLHKKLDALQGNVSNIRESVTGHSQRMADITRMIEALQTLIQVTQGPEGPNSRILGNINAALSEIQAGMHAANDGAASQEIVRSLTELRDRVAAQTAAIGARDAGLAERDASITALTEQKAELERQLRELQTSPNRNRGPIATLQAELTARKDREAALNTQIRELQERMASLTAASANTATRNDALLQTLRSEIQSLTEVRETLKGRIDQLRRDLRLSAENAESLRQRLAELEAERDALAAEQAEAIAEKDVMIRDLQVQLRGLERVGELERQLTDFELKLKSCTQAREAIERAHATLLEQQKTNNGAKDATIAKLTRELETYRETASQELAQRNADYGSRLTEEQRRQQAEYAASIQNMEDAMKEEIEAERQKAIAVGQKQKARIQELEEQLAAAESSRDADVAAAVAERDARIVGLTERIREIQEARNKNKEERDSDALADLRRTANAEQSTLNAELAKLRERCSEIEAENAHLTEERASLLKRVEDCEATVPTVTEPEPDSEKFPRLGDNKYSVKLPDDHLIYNINARVWIGDGLRKIFEKDRLRTNSAVPEHARSAAFAILSEFLTRTPDVNVLEVNNNRLYGYPELADVTYKVDEAVTKYTVGARHTPSDSIFASIGMLTYILEKARAPEWRAPYSARVPEPVPVRPPVVSNVSGSAQGRITIAPTAATRRYGRGTRAAGTATGVLPPPVPGKKAERKTRKQRRR